MGGELFYTDDRQWWVVSVETGSRFSYESPSALISGDYVSLPNNERPNFDVSPDGQRFLMMKTSRQSVSGQTVLVVVENWFEELRRLAPVGE